MKKLLLFAGLPGVGKSTISKILSKKTGAKIVDLDDFKRTEVDSSLVKTQIDPPEIRWGYYQKALEYTFSVFNSGISMVAMDEIFHLNSLRMRLETLCVKKCQVLWVEVRCSYDTVDKRLKAKTREGHLLSSDEALKMNFVFSEIFEKFSEKIQNHIVVSNESADNVDLIVESILKKWS